MCYTYDDSGNILTKSVNGVVTDYRYADGTDRLMSFGNETFEYDGMGNPTKYRGLDCAWEKGRQLKQIFDGATVVRFTYDVFGIRTSKTVGNLVTNYIYENGKLLRQTSDSGRIDFIYGKDGMIGFKTGKNGTSNTEKTYLYRKNIFGDVVEIYDQNGNVVGKYSYSAFGECTIDLDTDGIAMENPIRYRGYYYDKELKLYYLKSRYYDPEVGRFITIDDISYLDPESINGLNLYAYCGNNPVMAVDPDGMFFLSLFLGLAVAGGAIIGGTLNGIKAYNEGQRGLGLFGAIMGGAVMGGAMGGILALGGAIGAATIFGTTLTIGGLSLTAGVGFGISLGVGAVAGMASYSLENGLRTDRTWSFGGMISSGASGMVKGGITYGIGYFAGKNGAYDKLFLKDIFADKTGMNLGRAIIVSIFNLPIRNMFANSAMIFGDFLTKLLLVSSIAAGARKIIDIIFGVN